MAVTASEALAASTAYVDAYCTDPPAEIRTAAIGLFARWIERYPSDGIVSVNHSDQSVSWAPIAMGSGVMLWGAAALLAPWRRPRGRVIEAAS